MTDSLGIIWAVLEHPDPIIANAAWQRLSETNRVLLDRVGILKRHTLNEIACHECSNGHRSPVHAADCPSGEIQYSIACPVELKINIDNEQRVTRRVEPKLVAESIACSLGLTGEVRSVSGDHFYFCGYYEHRDVRVEIYFGRGLCRIEGVQIASMLPRSFLPQFVWVPKDRPNDMHWDNEKPPAFLPLDGMTQFEQDGLVVFQDVFCSTVRELVLNRSHPEHMFVKRGDAWEVCFQGSAPVSVKASKGMTYIVKLLEFPGVSISAVDLHTMEGNISPTVMRGSKGEIIDVQAREDYQNRLPKLQASKEQARVGEDTVEVIALNEQIQAIEDQLRGSQDIRGELRARPDLDRARTSVTKAITTAIRNITRENHDLGRHLKSSISTGHDPVYRPDMEIIWMI